jgi:hypothetical protein
MPDAGQRLPPRDLSPEPVSIEEVNARYGGQWVLLKITAFDENHLPSHGHVVAHGSEKRVGKVLDGLASTPERWEPPYYFFCAYPRIRSGEALRAAIAEAAKQGDIGAGRLTLTDP